VSRRSSSTDVGQTPNISDLPTALSCTGLRRVNEYTGAYPSGTNWSSAPYATTQYRYDTLGELTDVWDAVGLHTQMSYDALGHKAGMSDQDQGT
jgi:YD repeat-containing protein